MKTLKFSDANDKLKKLKKKLPSFFRSLGLVVPENPKLVALHKLSGEDCPYAKACLSKVVLVNGKRTIQDGPHTEFRCYSASLEALYPALYNKVVHNTELVAGCSDADEYRQLIDASIPNTDMVRLHIGGDFKTQYEFDAWLGWAKDNPNKILYGYTKSLPFWVKRLKLLDSLPNVVLTASRGGWRDDLIPKHNLRSVTVVRTKYQARKLGLPLDNDDSHAAHPGKRDKDFALLIHGVQPKATK